MEELEEKIKNAKAEGLENIAYTSVNTNEAVGVVFLGILVVMLFVSLLKSQARYQELLNKYYTERAE